MSPSPTPPSEPMLIVEDEYFIAEDLRRELELRGATVAGPVATLEEGLRLAEEMELAGAVLDVNLRGEMVWPLAERLMGQGVPFVFATGYDRIVVPPKFKHVTVLQKPVDPEPLLEALSRALARA